MQRKSESRRTRRKRKKGKKGKKGKREERFLCVSLARVCVRAFQPQCCFFAVTSVTQREENRRKIDRKVRKLGEIEEKTTRKNVFFSVVRSTFLTIIQPFC